MAKIAAGISTHELPRKKKNALPPDLGKQEAAAHTIIDFFFFLFIVSSEEKCILNYLPYNPRTTRFPSASSEWVATLSTAFIPKSF